MNFISYKYRHLRLTVKVFGTKEEMPLGALLSPNIQNLGGLTHSAEIWGVVGGYLGYEKSLVCRLDLANFLLYGWSKN